MILVCSAEVGGEQLLVDRHCKGLFGGLGFWRVSITLLYRTSLERTGPDQAGPDWTASRSIEMAGKAFRGPVHCTGFVATPGQLDGYDSFAAPETAPVTVEG